MIRQGLDKRSFLRGLLILLLAPVLVLVLLALYVYIGNLLPQSGALQTSVSPQVVLPWGESACYITYNGIKTGTQPVENPIDMAFVVDVSGSMTQFLPAMSEAAHKMTRELEAKKPGNVRFALIQFDTLEQVITNWTDNPAELREGLGKLAVMQGGTDPNAAFIRLKELLGQARNGADKLVVFFTDGQWGNAATNIGNAEELRNTGVGIYSVGVPGVSSDQFMVNITGDRSRIFDPTGSGDFDFQFQSLALSMIPGLGQGGLISHQLDGRHFAAPLNGTNWTIGRGGALSLTVGRLPDSTTTFAHPLVPLSAGLWRVGVAPSNLTFADQNGQLQRITAARRPLLLKVTWFTLLLMLLPALLWILSQLDFTRHTFVEEKFPLPNVMRPSLPARLPALPGMDETREDPVPTLFIGLGGAGRRALAATRAELKQSHLARPGQPYRFLWVDLDPKEAAREIPFDDWADYTVEQLVAPADIRNAQTYLPEPGRNPQHLDWFPSINYRDAARERLNLSDGSRGDRALARLALFQWLARQDGKDDLLPALSAQLQELEKFPSVDGTRQVVIFAASDSGVGSGWLLDFGRLLNRLGRQRQKQRQSEFVPEIIGVLGEEPNSRHAANQQALAREIESALESGAFPQRTAYVPGDPLLDQTDAESPFHYVFAVSSADANAVAGQGGELGAVLTERQPRASLLNQAAALSGARLVSAASSAVHVLPTQIYDRVRFELFLRLLGPDILLDIAPTAQGGYEPKAVKAEDAVKHLESWRAVEPVGNPLQLLLSAAIDPTFSAAFLELAQKSDSSLKEWFGTAFPVSLSRRLHGHSDADGLRWHRDLMPGEAVSVLRLLVSRIEQNIKPDLKVRAASPATLEAVDYAAQLARTAAEEMEKWLGDFCQICERFSRKYGDQGRTHQALAKLPGRSYLSLDTDPDQAQQWVKQCLDNWLGSPDNISAIRQRLFFAATAEGGRSHITVRSCIAELQNFASVSDAAGAVDQLARSLAYLVPGVRIEGALANLSDDRRKMLARGLVNVQAAPRQVLVVMPKPSGTQSQRQALEDFKTEIPQPLTHGHRVVWTGDDHSAIRRLELVEAGISESLKPDTTLPFVEAAERAAELLRQRAEKKHMISVPFFPPQLRIALAHPEAFRSFASAYRAGYIVRRQDAAGAEQWAFLQTGEFLTFGEEQSLANAAANYAWYVPSPPTSFQPAGTGGSFASFEQWRKERNAPNDDTLVQIAIDACE